MVHPVIRASKKAGPYIKYRILLRPCRGVCTVKSKGVKVAEATGVADQCDNAPTGHLEVAIGIQAFYGIVGIFEYQVPYVGINSAAGIGVGG